MTPLEQTSEQQAFQRDRESRERAEREHDATVRRIDALLSEHAAMADRLRWRKQSEEPAPDSEIVAEKRAPTQRHHAFDGLGIPYMFSYGQNVDADSEWRPL